MTIFFVVEGDGAIYRQDDVPEDMIQNMILYGSAVSVFKRTTLGIQYADIDQVTHELTWKLTEKEE